MKKFKVASKISDKLIVFDGQHLCYRCFHTLNLNDTAGRPIGAVYGVIKAIKAAKKKYPGYSIAFAWDTSPKVRKEIYPEYKAHRGEKPVWFSQFLWQIDRLKEILPHLGVDQYQSEGYEADDIGAELVRLFKEKKQENSHLVLVTSDKDWTQLVSEESNVVMWDSMNDKLFEEKHIKETNNIASASGVAMIKTISGDKSDNVPSIKRFPKKIVSYIASVWPDTDTMKKEYEASREIPDKWKKEIKDQWKMLETNYKLVKLGYLKPEKMEYTKGEENIDKQKDFYNKHGFKSFLTEMTKEAIVKRSVSNGNNKSI